MSSVVITGGTGFVGANLIRRMLSDGHDLHLIVRPNHQRWRIEGIEDQIEIHTVDMRDVARLSSVVRDIGPKWGFHCAAHGAYSWQNDVNSMIETNIASTLSFLRACHAGGCEAVALAGTSSEYGFKDHAPSESERLEPNSYYAVTKAASTHIARCFAVENGDMRVGILRLYSVFGPYEDPRRFIPTLIIQGRRSKLPPLVDPSVARDFVYVSDVCEAFVRVVSSEVEEPGAVFNIGSGVQTSISDAVIKASELLGISEKPEWGSYESRSWDTSSWVGNVSKAQRILGWQAKHSFGDGLMAFSQWFDSNPRLASWYEEKILDQK